MDAGVREGIGEMTLGTWTCENRQGEVRKGHGMDLDVVIVTYNSAAHLPAVLGALPEDVNVIVIDNASRDDSLDVARELGYKAIENATNSGFGAAANRGATRGNAELILFLNPDAIVDRAALETLVATFDDPKVAVAAPQLYRPDGTKQRTSWPFPSSQRAWQDAFGLGRRHGRPRDDEFVVGAVFMCRRSAFETAGGFDARFWLYGEETDLCRRLLDTGWELRLVPEARAIHSGRASWVGGSALAREHRRRGEEHYIAKHEGRDGLLSYRLARLVGSGMRAWLPGPEERRIHHRLRFQDTGAALARAPLRVAVDSPVTRVPGAGIVVLSTAAWSDPGNELRAELEDLLDADPERRILYVEPPHVPVARLWRRHPGEREAGLRPVHADGRVVRFQPVQLNPFKTGSLNQWHAKRQIRRALQLFALDGPTYVVADPAFRRVIRDWGVPHLIVAAPGWPRHDDTTSVVDEARARRLEQLRHQLAVARDGDPDERFRVLYLAHRGDIGGNTFAMERLLQALDQVDPHIILGDHGPAERRLTTLGHSVEVLPVAPELIVHAPRARLRGRLRARSLREGLQAARNLRRRIVELEPDVVHTTTITSAIIGSFAVRRTGIPVVWQMRDGINADNLSRPAVWGLRLAGRMLADGIITNSQSTWRALGLARRRKVTASRVIGDLVQPAPSRTRDYDRGVVTVAMVSRLVPWKGQQVFLDAFAAAFGDGNERAIVVGEADDVEYAADLVTQATQLGIADRVTFTGFVDDVGPLLDGVDILVHASLRPEPFSQVIVEGMARGLPVIASRSYGAQELINDGMDGMLAPPSDVEALAERLRTLGSDPGLRRRLGMSARRRANAFRPEVVAAQITRTYRQVVTAARHRR